MWVYVSVFISVLWIHVIVDLNPTWPDSHFCLQIWFQLVHQSSFFLALLHLPLSLFHSLSLAQQMRIWKAEMGRLRAQDGKMFDTGSRTRTHMHTHTHTQTCLPLYMQGHACGALTRAQGDRCVTHSRHFNVEASVPSAILTNQERWICTVPQLLPNIITVYFQHLLKHAWWWWRSVWACQQHRYNRLSSSIIISSLMWLSHYTAQERESEKGDQRRAAGCAVLGFYTDQTFNAPV